MSIGELHTLEFHASLDRVRTMITHASNGSVVERLAHWAHSHGAKTACAFLADGKHEAGSLSYAALAQRVQIVGAELRARDAAGVPVLILCPAGLEYVTALFGCFAAGAIAVPAYPPTRTGVARTLPRIRAICRDCAPRLVLITRSVRAVLDAEPELRAVLSNANTVVEVDTLVEEAAPRDPVHAALSDAARSLTLDAPALLQYTSGSTAEPKGVLITHGQLAANAELIHASGLCGTDTMISWLPPYHDMGLIGGILAALYVGARTVLMPPDVFLRRPRRWLEAVSQYRGTVLVTPNFALDACVRRIPEGERASFDLSSVEQVYIGAEPVRAVTLARFAHAFAPCGLRRETLYPCYGMAEATLIISGGDRKAPPIAHGDAIGCGRALPGSRICIVSPETHQKLHDGAIGEIWVQSPSAASLYWRNPEATEHTFRAYTQDGEGPFLRTGDLGQLRDGELFITGRIKDVIIVRGRNHYPQDIERTVQAIDDALVIDAGAAFSVMGEDGEQLVIVQEVDKRTGVDPEALIQRIPAEVIDHNELVPSAIALIKRGSLPKTSSGKVQRNAARKAWLEGALQIAAELRVGTQPAVAPRRAAEPPLAAKSHGEIEAWLRARVASKVGLEPDAIDASEPVARYGVDSALAAEIIDELQQWIELRLDTTISYDHPTIAGLARAIRAMKTRTLPRNDAPRRPAQRPPSIHARQRAERDPIVIVGMACRFPGAPDLESFWTLLEQGRDAITTVPAERWDADGLYDPLPGAPGKSCSKWGGFIDDIELFDASFFGISAHEAASMDPQQRLFLEVTWQALENAGQAPTALAGSRCGVFAGVCSSDFASLYAGDLHLVGAEYGTGSSPSLVANRLSYVLDLRGPSETVDSACSSSLVALHHACRSLSQADCDMAIVGGVNAVLAPEVSISLSHLGALARDGRCKAFDHRADGFVRSEGAGVVILKRLSSAVAARDRIYAVVSSCAVNHDGRSNGLTAPSGPAQRDVIARALASAEVSADAIDYVETHGVGAPIADAVELRALGAIASTGTRQRPLLVGSVKTNLGHLEAASGIASIIKVALSLANEHIPKQIHFQRVPEGLDLDALSLEVATAAGPWRRGPRPRFAGVSAFGFGGANAHAILREAPALLPVVGEHHAIASPQVLVLSARTPAALAASVRNLANHLGDSRDTLADICFTAGVGRAEFPERLAIVCPSVEGLRDGLLSFALGARENHVYRGTAKQGALKLAFAFTEAPVRARTLRALWTAHPRLTQAFELSHQVLLDKAGFSLRALLQLSDDAADSELAREGIAHAARAAAHHALATLLVELGVEPCAVYGHGAGEYAAAAASGALPWDAALELAALRGSVREGLSGGQPKLTLRGAKLRLAQLDSAMVSPNVPLVSELAGRVITGNERPDPAHWARHLLAPMPRQLLALESPNAPAIGVVLELGGACELAGLPAHGWFTAIDEQRPPLESFLQALAALYVRGASVHWSVLLDSPARRKVSLPTYPFERERHWLDFPVRDHGERKRPSERPSSHPLVSRMRISAQPGQSGFIRRGDAPLEEAGEPPTEQSATPRR